MSNLSLKNVPEKLHNQLREQAAANHRSVNREAIAALEWAVIAKPADVSEILREARKVRARVKGTLSTQELNKWKRQGRP